jgi:SprT protein
MSEFTGLSVDKIGSLIGLVSTQKQIEVEARIEECFVIAERHFDRELTRPQVTYDLKGTTAGWAINGERIRLNYDLMHGDHYDDMINQIVPHETAHLIVHQIWPTAKPHGMHWEHVMAILGVPATRCHNYDVTPAKKHKKFHYTCACGIDHKIGSTRHRRAQSGIRYRCTRCRSQLRFTGEMS